MPPQLHHHKTENEGRRRRKTSPNVREIIKKGKRERRSKNKP
jgi:hypothetical protein